MARYIGSNAPYGFFEKQVLALTGATSEYQLLYGVGSPSGILVIYNDVIQEANLDYSLTNGGKSILFAFVPLVTDRIWILFLGRELAIATVAGAQPYRAYAQGNGATTVFTLPVGPVVEQALIIFIDGIHQRYIEHWNIDGSGYNITFVTPPTNGADIDFYIHGIERTDLVTVDDHSIDGSKLQIGINIGTLLQPAGIIFATDLTLTGNLTVNGTTTTINTDTLSVEDNEVILNSNFLSGSPTLDSGIRIKRGSSPDALIYWDETNDWMVAGITTDLQKVIRFNEFNAHVTNFTNPHAVTKTQVGLGNVTNDAQLKRAANDFSTFAVKAQSSNSDVFILEDSGAAGVKKYVIASDILPPVVDNDITFTGAVTIGSGQSQGFSYTSSTNSFETAATIPILDNTTVNFEVKVAARYDNTTTKSYWASANGAVLRNNGSAAILIETSPGALIDDGDYPSGTTGYDLQFIVSGNNLLVQVKGGSGESVKWNVHIELFKVS